MVRIWVGVWGPTILWATSTRKRSMLFDAGLPWGVGVLFRKALQDSMVTIVPLKAACRALGRTQSLCLSSWRFFY